LTNYLLTKGERQFLPSTPKDDEWVSLPKKYEISLGSSDCFTPEVKESYWRIVHATSILKNWDIACDIINTHCKMYADLEKECYEQKVSS